MLRHFLRPIATIRQLSKDGLADKHYLYQENSEDCVAEINGLVDVHSLDDSDHRYSWLT